MLKPPDPPVVALLTDMGLSDWYVGTMKGVVLSIAPNAHLVDITHSITKQAIQEAAFVLMVSHDYFPPGTIFLCVVDPGVGSDRKPVVARDEKYFYVAPNNGLLTYVATQSTYWQAHIIEQPELMLETRSQTFHGRDIFAPAAAHLCNRTPLDDFGAPLGNLVKLPYFDNIDLKPQSLAGRIIYIDSYGNLLTNVTPEMLGRCNDPHKLKLRYKNHLIIGIAPHFAAVPFNHPLMYWGSSGLLEIGINQGSAARKWSSQQGEFFELEWV
ncbi:MAG TPA: SAM-dependent chlorinase/fluorinase [Candidatus Sumerlaeota bacterium]|nr:SAM-dependent chlorinase/fluorinase [Candidatus Sumerlaeota bacterium]HPS00767.1 SAM-dependent chlorinase/fluorinase [Candidatus Sumerlaeota bacterium]